jgi:hypothetical protein
MMKVSPKQLGVIHALLVKRDLLEHKAEIVEKFTEGRTRSSRELTMSEARALIGQLGGASTGSGSSTGSDTQKASTGSYSSETDPSHIRQVRYIMAMAHEMGWQKEGKKIDMARLDAWCISHGHGHKALREYSTAELPKLVTQMQLMLTDYRSTKPIRS